MPPRAERSTVPESVRRGRQRLPVPVSPMCSETLNSYLRRVMDQNLLRPGWLPQLSRQPHFVTDLVELTGLTERGLVTALPELRTPHAVERWPHLVGRVSKRAGIRSACRHCAAAQTQSRSQPVTVFASHEQVLCAVHQQWTGSSALRCDAQQQFSVRLCPDIARAHRQHRSLIRRWGRGPTYSGFTAAVTCFSQWSGWPAVSRALDTQQRRRRLGVPEEAPSMLPRQAAAWYPNAVALSDVIISLRYEAAVGRKSPAATVIAESLVRLQGIVPGLSPSGASDPFRQAILGELDTPPDEVEVAPSNHSHESLCYRKDDGGNVEPKS